MTLAWNFPYKSNGLILRISTASTSIQNIRTAHLWKCVAIIRIGLFPSTICMVMLYAAMQNDGKGWKRGVGESECMLYAHGKRYPFPLNLQYTLAKQEMRRVRCVIYKCINFTLVKNQNHVTWLKTILIFYSIFPKKYIQVLFRLLSATIFWIA